MTLKELTEQITISGRIELCAPGAAMARLGPVEDLRAALFYHEWWTSIVKRIETDRRGEMTIYVELQEDM